MILYKVKGHRRRVRFRPRLRFLVYAKTSSYVPGAVFYSRVEGPTKHNPTIMHHS